jgi:hypothetical protein
MQLIPGLPFGKLRDRTLHQDFGIARRAFALTGER